MSITNSLKDIRAMQHLAQEDLAVAIGSCSRTISRIECGKRNPSLETAIRISHYLEVPVEEIFRLDDEGVQQEKAGE